MNEERKVTQSSSHVRSMVSINVIRFHVFPLLWRSLRLWEALHPDTSAGLALFFCTVCLFDRICWLKLAARMGCRVKCYGLIMVMLLATLNHNHRQKHILLPVPQNKGFAWLLPCCNYSNWRWAIALIGWGRVPAVAAPIGCALPLFCIPIGQLEEGGRRERTPSSLLWLSL